MLRKLGLRKKSSDSSEFEYYVDNAKEVCKKLLQNELAYLGVYNYRYLPEVAANELGLDDELVQDLIEDYVAQIIKNISDFRGHINKLKSSKRLNTSLDYKPLRDLAHKNLGVARNLRITDAQKILSELMKKDDLQLLENYVSALEACAILLNPRIAYKTSKIQKIKNTL